MKLESNVQLFVIFLALLWSTTAVQAQDKESTYTEGTNI